MCVYGDLAYPLNIHLQGPFKGVRITPIQNEYNTAMSRVRASVEWVFGDIINYFAFMDFKKNLKIRLSAVGKMYIVCGLLTNACTCLYQSVIFWLGPTTTGSLYSVTLAKHKKTLNYVAFSQCSLQK